MRVYCAKDYYHASRTAANIISAQVIMKPDCVLGLATGSTPIGTYEQLIKWYEKGDLDFSKVRSINLDEYRGLPADNDQSKHAGIMMRLSVLTAELIYRFLVLDIMDISGSMNRQALLLRELSV